MQKNVSKLTVFAGDTNLACVQNCA